jgi:Spy/CpxP family protein refolding chaperone
MKTLRSGLIGLALTAALVPTTMWAAEHFGHGGTQMGEWGMFGGQGGMVLRLADKLGLGAGQITQINTILAAAATANRPTRDQLQTNRQTFEASYDPSQYDASEVSAYIALQTPLVQQLVTSGFETRAKVLAVLTPSQLTQFEALRASFAARRQARHGQS